MSRRRLLVALPLVAFAALAILLYMRLQAGDPSRLPSALIGRPAPALTLPPLEGVHGPGGAPLPGVSGADFGTGSVVVVNVWASWCVPCRDEHPQLIRLARMQTVRLVGLNYKDAPENARRFLAVLGNPYEAIGVDAAGRAAIEWGVYGVPETFVVDGAGRIAYRYIGPLTEETLISVLVPQIEKARGGVAGLSAGRH